MTDDQTVLVLGGGVGGVVSAVRLRKKLPSRHRVVVIERDDSPVFSASLLWLMIGKRKPRQISRPLHRLRARGIEVILGEIESIVPRARQVTVGGAALDGDHMVISLGAELAPMEIPGLPQAGHNIYTLNGMQSLRDELQRFDSGRLVILTADPAYKCPAAPYEAAMLLDHDCRKRGVRSDVELDLYAAEPGPMGVTGPELSAAVRDMVEQKGITYHPEHQVTEVDPSARTLKFANGQQATYDLLAYVPPHRAPRVVTETDLVNATGWVPVDRHTLETEAPGVYAIGDVNTIPLTIGKPLPMAGVFAHGQANVVAANIAHAITGRDKPERFQGHGVCFIETGAGKAGMGSGDFYAEPSPAVGLRAPGYTWHLGKKLVEQVWLRGWMRGRVL